MLNTAQLVGSIKLAKFMELTEEKFEEFVKETKTSYWFKEFMKYSCSGKQLDLWPKEKEYFNLRGFSKLKKEKDLTSQEAAEIEELKRKLRLINTRKTIIHKLIEGIKEYQKDYLNSGKLEDLKPLSQLTLSQLTGIDNSIISRVVNNGYMIKSANGSIPLSFLFVKEGNFKKRLIKNVLDGEKANIESGGISDPYSDEQVKKILKEKYKVIVSRRFVNKCRKELGIGSSYERMKPNARSTEATAIRKV